MGLRVVAGAEVVAMAGEAVLRPCEVARRLEVAPWEQVFLEALLDQVGNTERRGYGLGVALG